MAGVFPIPDQKLSPKSTNRGGIQISPNAVSYPGFASLNFKINWRYLLNLYFPLSHFNYWLLQTLDGLSTLITVPPIANSTILEHPGIWDQLLYIAVRGLSHMTSVTRGGGGQPICDSFWQEGERGLAAFWFFSDKGGRGARQHILTYVTKSKNHAQMQFSPSLVV